MKKKTNKGIVLIKKSNNLIESRYKFDIWETRFFLSVLAQIRRDDDDFHCYRIWYKDVIKTFGLKSGDSYALLRDAARSLHGKSFFVSYEKDGAKREQQYHILRHVDVLADGQKDENHEYIDVTVEQEMRPFLLELQKNFTAYDLRNIVKLNVYPVRVYELLKQYETIGNRKLKVTEMKKMFEVTDKYKAFGDFYRWVVKPAIKEINKHTDLTITDVEKIKEGRRVVALRFKFKGKRGEELALARGESVQKEFEFVKPENMAEEVSDKDRIFDTYQKDVVARFGVTPSSFLRLLDDYNEAQIKQAIRVTGRAKFNQQIKSSVAGFFVQALKNGYTDEKEEADRKKVVQIASKQSEDEKKKRIQQLKREKAKAINAKIKELTSQKPNTTDKAIADLRESPLTKIVIDQKEEKFGRTLVVEDFRKDKMLRELVKGKIVETEKAFFQEVLEEYEGLLKKVGH